FSIRASSIAAISYADILRGDPAAIDQLKGKKALVGGTAIELGDRFNTPNGRVISGALLHALAAESMLQDRILRSPSVIFALLGVGLIALVAMISRRRLPISIQLV